MSPTKKQDWYDVDTVVELLIHETPRGERYAPEISNLCIGFTSFTLETLGDEIEDIRSVWPFIFPKATSTSDLLRIVKKKYPAYKDTL